MNYSSRWGSVLLSSLLLLALPGCDGSEPSTDKPETPDQPDQPTAPTSDYDLTIPTVKYAFDAAAGDKAVSAELGGPGFTGEGWETNLEFMALGQQGGVPQGGSMTFYMPDWPSTLRMAGQGWNTSLNYTVASLAYEPMLRVHEVTMEYIPVLATHWQISEDKSTYRFRINPAARWSDGEEVTAEDVVATWKLRTNPDLLFPSSVVFYSTLEEPVAVSKYIVEVKVKEESWQNFLKIAGMTVLPEHKVGAISGEDFLDQYQFAYLPGTGPYAVKEEDVVTGQSVTLTRRSDWWGEDNPAWEGMYNIGKLKHVVVKEPGLAFEKLKKGEIDYMIVPKAQWWAEEMPEIDSVKRGLLVMRKFYNDYPIGTSGLALNASRKHLDDVRIRKALQHLYDRATMIEKLYYNEYEPLTSYWQGGTYANPGNALLEYDELTAVELLEAAGWTELNDEGYRVKDGESLSFNISYRSSLSERNLTIFQEAAKRAGIKLELQLLTPASHWKNMQAKEYDIASMAWGAIIFPNPRSGWHSEYATQPNNNNITAYANEKVDALIAQYEAEYDATRRAEIIQQMDALIYSDHPYILGWYNPAHRIAFWNKYSMPEWAAPRLIDADQLYFTWWVDPEKEAALTAAIGDQSQSMDPGERHNRFWQAWNEAQAADPGGEAQQAPTEEGDASGDAAPDEQK